MHWTKTDLEHLGKIERLNLINSVTGAKPANLIGTQDKSGNTNLAIFSSVFHLGSNPALLGFIVRPTGEVPRNTYENIRETTYFTINHVHEGFVENAHYTSAKFAKEASEFDYCGFTPEYKMDFFAPFVAESTIQMGLQLVEEIPIERNGTILMIGEIQHLFVSDAALEKEGHIHLEKAGSVAISGLNSYYTLEKIAQFPYARVSELPDFIS